MYTMKWWLGLCFLCGWLGVLVIILLIIDDRKFNYMVFNNEILFIGVINYIYQFSLDFEMEMKIIIGF